MSKSNNYRNNDARRNSTGKQNDPANKRGQKFGESKGRSRNRSKRNIDEDMRDQVASPRNTANDFSWYNNNPELIQAAARVPFASITGASIPGMLNNITVPGVMSLMWTPRFGGYENTTINRASRDYYSYVVHANSRNTSYTASDLMLMTLAVGEIFSAIAVGIRAYGLMKQYFTENTYTPDVLNKASMFSKPENLRSSYSHMWFDINNLIAQANTLWIPDDMPFIQRRFWLSTNVYIDADNVKGQYYEFRPYTFYTYSPTTSETGGELIALSATEEGAYTNGPLYFETWESYVAAVQNMINALNSDEDRGLIMGDILKAYGPDRLVKIAEIPIDYQTPIVFDETVLMQIENAHIMQSFVSKFKQEDDDIYSVSISTILKDKQETAKAYGSLAATPRYIFLNYHSKEAPSVEAVTEMTRFSIHGTTISNASKPLDVQPTHCGTETLCGMSIYYWIRPTNADPILGSFSYTSLMPTANQLQSKATREGSEAFGLAANIATLENQYMIYSLFDWAPILYTSSGTTLPDTVGNWSIGANFRCGDLDNYTVVENGVLERIHDACVYSEFGFGTRK